MSPLLAGQGYDTCCGENGSLFPNVIERYVATDSYGTQHRLYFDGTNPAQLRSGDGSGLLFVPDTTRPFDLAYGSTAGTLYDPRGISYAPPSGAEYACRSPIPS